MVNLNKSIIEYSEFEAINICVGKIISAELIEGAKHSTHKLLIDFGEKFGERKSCARLVKYELSELIGRQVVAVLNFNPKQIGKNISEVLVLGVPDEDGECRLLTPERDVPLGGKIF
jgi:tRNA-binding protein